MYSNEIKSLVNTSVRWVITCSIVGTFFKKESKSFVRKNKAIRNIPLDVDLIRFIILELGPECFGEIY
jgi:hypothetical protein